MERTVIQNMYMLKYILLGELRISLQCFVMVKVTSLKTKLLLNIHGFTVDKKLKGCNKGLETKKSDILYVLVIHGDTYP